MPSSGVVFACAASSRLDPPTPSLPSSLSLGCESATLIDIRDSTSATNLAPSTSDEGLNDATKRHDVPLSSMVQLKTGFFWLFQLALVMIVQVAVMVADIVALKTRITEVEDRVQVLTFVRDEIESLRQTIDTLQHSMARREKRVDEVKTDSSSKIAQLQSELTAVREELAAVRMVALPVDISVATQAVKEAGKAPILTSTTQRIDNAETKIVNLSCPPPPACTATSSSVITLSRLRKPEERTIRTLKTIKEPLATACPNVVRPGANKVSPKPIGRTIPTLGGGKENKPPDSSTTASQRTRPSTSRPSLGRITADVKGKAPAVSPPKKAQPGAGLPSNISALPKRRKSTLPALQKSPLPDVVEHVVGDDGSSSSGSNRSTKVKPAGRRPRGSETQAHTTQPKTAGIASVATSSTYLEQVPTQVQEPRAVLPPSSSLAALDAFLEAMGDNEYLLTSTPIPECLDYDWSFSTIPSIPMITKHEDDGSANASPEPINMGVRPSHNSMGENATENAEVLLAASSSLAALDAAFLERQGDCNFLTLTPGPDFHNAMLEFSFSPISQMAVSRGKRRALHVSP